MAMALPFPENFLLFMANMQAYSDFIIHTFARELIHQVFSINCPKMKAPFLKTVEDQAKYVQIKMQYEIMKSKQVVFRYINR